MLDEVRRNHPRVLFVGYGETDEWAHLGRYDRLLDSAQRVDRFIAELWDTMQAIPQYRGKTTFLITTDHGRGHGLEDWKDHGDDVAGILRDLDRGARPGHAGPGRATSGPTR